MKRQQLRDLISGNLVIPSNAIIVILGEALKELDNAERKFERDLEEIERKYAGTIKDLEDELVEKNDDIADLQTDVCETHATAAEILTVIEDGRDAEGE